MTRALPVASLGGPVVVKVLDPAIAHKAEVGGVHVGVAEGAALEAALDQIDAISTLQTRGYLVEALAEDGVELLVGGLRDPVWGPVIAFGAGGANVEAHAPSMRLAPLSDRDVAALVAEVDPSLDPSVIAPVFHAVAALLLAHPEITEVDVNPVRITAAGAVALDALVVTLTQRQEDA